jgi:hypothetical protein
MVRLLFLSGLILLLAAPTASAGVREDILRECQDGRITGNYTPRQLRDARKHIPTDIDEYSDCRDVLSQAALSGRGGASGGGAGSAPGPVAPGGLSLAGSTGNLLKPQNARERAALADARKSPGTLTVAGDHVIPGAAGFADAAARHGVPRPLLAVLILLTRCALGAAAPTVRRRVLRRGQP